ncbi:hypothetical protein ACOSQ3_022777 [Xanthoceras sorbifolium]
MKGGNYYLLTARHLFLTLIALILTTIILLDWEKFSFDSTPVSATIPSSSAVPGHSLGSIKPEENSCHSTTTEDARENFPSSVKEFHDSLNDSASMNPKEDMEKTNSHFMRSEETEKKVETFGSPPMNLTTLYSPGRKDSGAKNKYTSKAEACDYAKGRWVINNSKPLYSPLWCKHLSKMWSCKQTHRTDFSYEKYRWQPMNCEIPQFDRLAFLTRMQDKTIAFIGDSLGRQQFQSLMCMLTGRKKSPEVEDVGNKYGLSKPYGAIRGAVKRAGWAYRFPNTNTTILMYWSVSLCYLEPLNITGPVSPVAIHLDRPATFLRQYLHQFDILVLNTGHHWNKEKFKANQWVMYVNGKPNKKQKLSEFWTARNFAVQNIVRWLDSQLPLHRHLKAFFRTISPEHFRNGKWNTGGRCDNTVPLTGGNEVVEDGSMDVAVEGAVKGTGVKILDITGLSDLRDEAHISHYRGHQGGIKINDCLHWCLPGIPDTWNEILFAQT